MYLSTDRHIAHLDLDSFYIAVEELRDPKLKGKPVLLGGAGDRGVVACCNPVAAKFGIHTAMPMRIAKRLCSHAVIVRGDMEQYSQYSRLVTEVIKENVPVFEKPSIDEFYIDLTGMDRFFGCTLFTTELKNKLMKETGLSFSFALSSNKMVSKVANNEVKPNGQIEIPFGQERTYLAPLSVTKMPGIGHEKGYRLLKMGIETVRTLSEMPLPLLQNFFEKDGNRIWRNANGIDESPVIPYHEQKTISAETVFDNDTIDMLLLNSTLVRMTEQIAFELRKQNKLTGCIIVKLRYTDGQVYTKQATVSYTNADHLLLDTAKSLFKRLYERRLLIRMIGIRFTNLVQGNYQVQLFDDLQESINMYRAIDSVKKRFGESLLVRAGGFGGSMPA